MNIFVLDLNQKKFCKKCGTEITEQNRLPKPYDYIFECLECGHPHLHAELISGGKITVKYEIVDNS